MPESRDEARLLRLATAAAVATAVFLIAGKAAAWWWTGSVAVLASLLDSAMDLLASTINLVAVRYSLVPPDREHRFGHGKAEPLAGLAQALFITGSAVFLIVHALARLAEPVPLEQVGAGAAVMAGAIAVTLILLAIQRHVIRRTGSTAVQADALHYRTDVLTNLGTLAALGLAPLGWVRADPVFGLIIGGYILFSAWRIGHQAFHLLMDRELPEAVRHEIERLALAGPGVRGIHDLRTCRSGRRRVVQLHLEMDGRLPLSETHAAADAVAEAIRRRYPDADVTIHQDPV
ncbi:MAG TPA: cation diffusion facilitator family transporter [Gammaproteobacteria bacterium]|nr:cation diffusion facilitator family transporter [Gammaproteobacteria bacterium]